MEQRRFGLTAEGVEKLNVMSAELLDLLKENMPDKTGQESGWKIEKAHSILHKAREIIMFGWSENFSTQVYIMLYNSNIACYITCYIPIMTVRHFQGPEHCHIDFIKNLAHCTNNKDVFLTILRCHVRAGHIQYLRNLQADLEDADGEGDDDIDINPLIADRDDGISCELGVRYPMLQSIMSGDKNHQTIQVATIYVMLYIMLYNMLYNYMPHEQVQGRRTYSGKHNHAPGHRFHGKECLDIHLLKAAAHEALAHPEQGLIPFTDVGDRPEWVTYPYRTAHTVLRWLPSKLAEWIAENYGQDLLIPAKSGDKWSVEELNNILVKNLVPCGQNGGHLRTFGTIQWECDLYKGRPKARCYPFNLDGHRFRGKNPQVLKPCFYCYVTVI